MVRIQVRLTTKQAQTLKRLARQQQRSVAALIRESVDLYLTIMDTLPPDEQYSRALALVGKYTSGDADVGRRHDAYLAEAYAVQQPVWQADPEDACAASDDSEQE